MIAFWQFSRVEQIVPKPSTMPYANRLSFLLFTALVVTLTACEEDTEITEVKESLSITVSPGVSPPRLKLLESPSATVAKFSVSVDTSQAQDTVYYAVLEAPAEAPNGPALLTHERVVKFLMSGNVFRPAYQLELSEQTEYVVYALIKEGSYVSEITRLNLREQPRKPTTDPVAGGSDEGDNPDEKPVGGEDGETDGSDPGQGGGDDSGDSSGDANGGDDTGSDSGSDGSGGTGGGDGSTDPDDGGDNGGETDPGDGGGEPDGIQPTLASPAVERTGLESYQRFQISVAVTTDTQVQGTIYYLVISEASHEKAPTPQELLDDRHTKNKEIKGDRLDLSIGANNDTKYYIYFLLKIGDEVSEVVPFEAKTAP